MNRKQRRAAGPGSPADAPFAAGLAAHRTGEVARAEGFYRRVLLADPGHADALNLLGVLAMQAGRTGDAHDLLTTAAGAAPGHAGVQYNLGEACRALGRATDAAVHYRRAAELQPGHQGALNNLGLVLHEQGQLADAAAAFRAALRAGADARVHRNLAALLCDAGEPGRAVVHLREAIALAPGDMDARVGLATTQVAAGDPLAGLGEACRVLDGADRPDARVAFATAAVALGPECPPRASPYLARALAERWARPRDLARPAAALALRRAGQDATAACLATYPLLLALLAATPVALPELEAALARVRGELLDAAEHDHDDPGLLPFWCALARQCFLNEYLFDEDARAPALAERLAALLADGRPVPPVLLAAVAAYQPLWHVPGTGCLDPAAFPAPIGALLAQQVREPLAEQALAAATPALTPVEAPVSLAVRAQYEENPYPRWAGLAVLPPPVAVDAHMARLFPGRGVAVPCSEGVTDILVAGCGTGQQSAEVARMFRNARVLAVDLSLASLAYAQRAGAMPGILRHAQADLLRMRDTGLRFGMIQASGVLHHLHDPGEGWRALLDVLLPGGVMLVGLYSERARADVAAVRATIAAEGVPPTPDGIRRCRRTMIAAPEGSAGRRLSRSTDFGSLSGCRDLLFHVQEHRTTLPALAALLAELRLEFLGFDLPAPVLRSYRAATPDDPALTDLAAWDRFEAAAPGTFAGMYQFWVRAPGG